MLKVTEQDWNISVLRSFNLMQKGCRFTLGDVANVLKRLIFDTYESSYPAEKEDKVKMNSSGIDDGE